MNFNEKLKTLRKQSGLSQEQLAEKINVSRQAITKWESDSGMPDIDNLIQIAKLFRVTLDDLVVYETVSELNVDYIYESVTEYDIDLVQYYDINVGGARQIILSSNEMEKIRVRLASNVLQNLDKAFKVKIDENKTKLDIDIKHTNLFTNAQAKEELTVFIELPQQIGRAEMKTIATELVVKGLNAESFEIEGKVSKVIIEGYEGNIALDTSLDMDITCEGLKGRVEVNQISATSVINVPMGSRYSVIKKGRSNRISYTADMVPCTHENSEEAEFIIDLAGMRTELVVNEYSNKERLGE